MKSHALVVYQRTACNRAIVFAPHATPVAFAERRDWLCREWPDVVARTLRKQAE
jgi:hypothetical protein